MFLDVYHIGDTDEGKIEAISFPCFGVDGRRTGRTLTATQDV
jgi:hypothetical protein